MYRPPALFAQTGHNPVLIDGTSYVSADGIIQDKGFQSSWDPVLKNLVVKGPNDFLKFHVGSPYGLSKGKIVELGGKVRFLNGNVMIPESAGIFFEELSFSPKPTIASRVLPSTPMISQSLYGAKKVETAPRFQIRRVVIDAGHGGRDFGAISPRGTREKELALEVATGLRDELEKLGIEAILSRDKDVFIPLKERALVANKKNADFFISVHANASTSRSLQGFEIYYLSEATDDAALAVERAENSVLTLENTRWENPNADLKKIYWDLKETENRKESIRIAHHVAEAVESSAVVSHRRIRAANFYVLKWTECPAVLLELGYITNPADERRLKSALYRRQLVQGIVKGIMEYKAEFEKTDGFTQ